MAKYDVNGNVIPEDGAFNFRDFTSNNAGGYSGQSVSPSYVDAFSSYTAPTNYGMSLTPQFSDLVAPATTAASGPGFMSGMLGSTAADGTKTAGWGGMALGTVQGIGNMYMGMKQFGLAKEQLKSSKEQFAMNYGYQRTMTNNNLYDRNVDWAS